MKKILLGLGSVVTIVVPVASIVACGTTSDGWVEPPALSAHEIAAREIVSDNLMDATSNGWKMTTLKAGSEFKDPYAITADDIIFPVSKNGFSYVLDRIEYPKKRPDLELHRNLIDRNGPSHASREIIVHARVTPCPEFLAKDLTTFTSTFSMPSIYTEKVNELLDKAKADKVPPVMDPQAGIKMISFLDEDDFTPPKSKVLADLGYKKLIYRVVDVKQSPTTLDKAIVTIDVRSSANYTKTVRYDTEFTGFSTNRSEWETRLNKEIDKAKIIKNAPTIVIGSETKVSSNVKTIDFTPPAHNGPIRYSIVSVKPSSLDKEKVIVSISISTWMKKTKTVIYDVEVGGFSVDSQDRILRENKKIDDAIVKAKLPTASPDGKDVTVEGATVDDLIAPEPTGTIFYNIKSVKPSQSSPEKNDVTISVHSRVDGTKVDGEYTVEVKAFDAIGSVVYFSMETFELPDVARGVVVPAGNNRYIVATKKEGLCTFRLSPKHKTLIHGSVHKLQVGIGSGFEGYHNSIISLGQNKYLISSYNGLFTFELDKTTGQLVTGSNHKIKGVSGASSYRPIVPIGNNRFIIRDGSDLVTFQLNPATGKLVIGSKKDITGISIPSGDIMPFGTNRFLIKDRLGLATFQLNPTNGELVTGSIKKITAIKEIGDRFTSLGNNRFIAARSSDLVTFQLNPTNGELVRDSVHILAMPITHLLSANHLIDAVVSPLKNNRYFVSAAGWNFIIRLTSDGELMGGVYRNKQWSGQTIYGSSLVSLGDDSYIVATRYHSLMTFKA